MKRSKAALELTALVACGLAQPVFAQAGHPEAAPPGQADEERDDVSAALALMRDFQAALDEVGHRESGGDPDLAHKLLAEVVQGELYQRLLQQHDDVVLLGLSAIDTRAASLGLVDIQVRVREAIHALLLESHGPEEPRLLDAEEQLGIVLYQTGDLGGATALFEHVHEVRERLLSRDHPDLLAAKSSLATVRKSLGDLAGALELDEYVLASRETSLPADHPDLLDSKQNLALTLYQLGDLEGSAALLERVHEARARSLPADHPSLLSAKQNLAVVRKDFGDFVGARELEEHVLVIREKSLPADHPAVLDTKQNLASTLFQLGEVESAVGLFEHVHAARERQLPAEHPSLLSAKQNLAVIRQALGNLEGALELDLHVHEARERLLPADSPALLQAKLNLASVLYELGDLTAAHDLFEHVHAAWQRLLPEEHPGLLMVKGNLAATLGDLGDLERALELKEHVLRVQQRTLPADHPSLLAAQQGVAATLYELGDYEHAHELFERVHAVWHRSLPSDHPDLLLIKSNLSAARDKLGDHEGARVLLDYVLEARKRTLPPEHPHLLATKQNLAVNRNLRGDLVGALDLLQDVHGSFEGVLDQDHRDLLIVKQNLAETRSQLGDYQVALELAQQVHAARERLLAADHPDLLHAKLALAGAHLRLYELDEALALYEANLEARERIYPADHPDVLSTRLNLAITRYELGDVRGAADLMERVQTSRERHYPAGHPRRLAAKTDLAVLRLESGDLEGALEAAHSLLTGQLARAETLRWESSRVAREGALAELHRLAVSLYFRDLVDSDEARHLDQRIFSVLESLRLVSTTSSDAVLDAARLPELEESRERLGGVRGQLNDLTLTLPGEAEELEAWRRDVAELADERDRLQREIRARLREVGVTVDPPTVAALAANLSDGAALVSFFRFQRPLARDSGSGQRPPPLDSLLAFVVTPDASIERVELGPTAPIEERLSAWREAFGRPLRGRGVGVATAENVGELQLHGEELRRLVLDPVLARVPEVAVLHLVLDDLLQMIPVEALPLDGSAVGDRIIVRHEPTVHRLLQASSRPTVEGRLVAAGGIDYDAETGLEEDFGYVAPTPPLVRPAGAEGSRSKTLEVEFERLPGTEREVELAGALFRERFDSEPVLLRGAKASKSRLRTEVVGARYLHLATHGWFAPETVMSMVDSLEERSELVDRAAETVRGFAPDTLCGLALAGANRGVNELGRVPGVMTAEELATLDLTNCDLAVLSACETNVGIRRAGQGIQSLQAALHTAGARTAITSLWRVDDVATLELMERFYTYLWAEGMGKAEALWKAKCDLRADGHPLEDWAAWVLSGDPE